MDGQQELTLEQMNTIDGVRAINEMFRLLFDAAPSDGDTVKIYQGFETPEATVPAGIGSIFLRKDGGASTSIYIKESDDGGATGWVAK